MYQRDLLYMVGQGYLTPPVGYRIMTDEDLSQATVAQGDFREAEVGLGPAVGGGARYGAGDAFYRRLCLAAVLGRQRRAQALPQAGAGSGCQGSRARPQGLEALQPGLVAGQAAGERRSSGLLPEAMLELPPCFASGRVVWHTVSRTRSIDVTGFLSYCAAIPRPANCLGACICG